MNTDQCLVLIDNYGTVKILSKYPLAAIDSEILDVLRSGGHAVTMPVNEVRDLWFEDVKVRLERVGDGS